MQMFKFYISCFQISHYFYCMNNFIAVAEAEPSMARSDSDIDDGNNLDLFQLTFFPSSSVFKLFTKKTTPPSVS